MFGGFPLTGLIGIKRVSTADDICIQYEPESDWVAVLCRPIQFGPKVIYRDEEKVLIPPAVVSEMQGHDWHNPVFTVRRDESGRWQWQEVEDELNWSAETVAAKFV